MKKVLAAAGTSLNNIVKANVYLSNFDDFQAMNEIYQEVKTLDHLRYSPPTDPLLQYFDPNQMPARTCVQVAALPLKAAVEIECIAALP